MNTWKDVYRSLDPKEPLTATDRRLERALYTNDFFDDVKDELALNEDRNYKLLLSGHTGCGKSTFLNLLAADETIRSTFHIVNYSVKELLDVNDIDYVDLLLSIAAQAITSLDEQQLKGIAPLLEKAEQLAQQIQGSMTTEAQSQRTLGATAGAGAEAKINFFEFLKSSLFARLQFEEQVRQTVREAYRTRITELISSIDSILLEMRTQLEKPLLILIDDTDKVPPDIGLKLFHDNGHHLAAPKANIVYVIDVSVSTSSKFAAVRGKFGAEQFFPAVKVTTKGDGDDEVTDRNIAIFLQLVRKRMGADLIDDDTAKRVIKLSGGVVRELVRLLQYAVFEAKGRVMDKDVEHARHRIANEFNLYGKHTSILKHVLADPDWMARTTDHEGIEHTLMELLHMPALFQYRNGENKWYRPYPVFIDWLRKL